jgi:hypothetical protein
MGKPKPDALSTAELMTDDMDAHELGKVKL